MTSVVYFVTRDRGGPIKIGCSSALRIRIRQLSSDMKEILTVLATAPGYFREEGRMHRQLAEHRLEGEWFSPQPEVLAVVDYVRTHGQLPPAPDEDREVVMARRYTAGETLQSIGNDFGMTRERVRQILRASGVPSLGLRPEHRQHAAPLTDAEREIAALYAAGETRPSDLCERYGLTNSELCVILNRSKTKRHGAGHFLKRPDTDEKTAKCAELYQAGVSPAVIADQLGLRFTTAVYRLLKYAGVPARNAARNAGRRGSLECRAADVIAAYRSGAPWSEIKSRFGASREGVKLLVRRHGVKLTAEEWERRLAVNEAERIIVVREQHARRRQAKQVAA